MWKCPTCGEPIDDQFDSCWQCTKVEPGPEPADDHRPERGRTGFWCAWRRGWLVLLMMLVYGAIAGLVGMFFEHGEGPLAVAGLAVTLFILPAGAYWIFVFFFGENVWPFPKVEREIPREDRAAALLDAATKLETRGRVNEALAEYETVVASFAGTAASHDAQKSIESLRAKIG